MQHRPLEGFVLAVTPFNFTAIAGNLPTVILIPLILAIGAGLSVLSEILVFRRSERWKRNLYTQFGTIVRLDSIGYAAPLATFYQSNPFPEDVQRPWYHLNRIED